MKIRTKQWGVAVAAVALAAGLAACGGGAERGELADDWDAIVEAANEEGEVIYYNGMTVQQGERLIEAFNKVYPEIEVKAERGASDIIARVDAQISSGTRGADVFSLGDPGWWVSRGDDMLPIEGPGAEAVPADKWLVEGKVASVSGAPYSLFVWNTNIFPEGFKTYEDFLDPKTKGKIGFRGDASVTAAGFLDFLETEFGEEYLREFGQLNPKKYPSVIPATEAVASGEVGATPGAQVPHVLDLIENGAPIDYHVPTPGYAFDYGFGALENAHNPNAAVVFTDFASSSEGQAALNGDGYGIATREGIDGAIPAEGWTFLDSSKFTPEAIQEWNRRIDELL